jgi:hypothetical protein
MTTTPESLYELLPAIYRIRDAEQGEPLKALLSVMARQVNVLEEDIDQLYENMFIETCEEWLVPYIGDLLAVRPLQSAGAGVFSLRAYVANTLAYRRRKGTVAVLEELARDVTGWPARAVEFFQLLVTSQHLNHLRLEMPGALRICGKDARDGLELLGGPFEKATHTVDVRRIASGRGKYNILNIGLYLWRLQAYTVRGGSARAAIDAPQGCFRFSPLGYDTPLFNAPRAEAEITHLAQEINVPGMLRRLPLYRELESRRAAIAKKEEPEALYFDENPVFEVFADSGTTPLRPDEIVICNLGGWEKPGWKPPESVSYGKDEKNNQLRTRVAVDPILGRIAWLDGLAVKSTEVTYSYGFSSAVGGGPYDRRDSVAQWHDHRNRPVTWQQEVTKAKAGYSLKNAIDAWNAHIKGKQYEFGIITITDSGSYVDALPDIEIPRGSRLAIVASGWLPGKPGETPKSGQMTPDNLRPHVVGDFVIMKPADSSSIPDADYHGEFIADGLLIEGTLTVTPSDLGLLHLAHCTFVPGVQNDVHVKNSGAIIIGKDNLRLNARIEHCIVGTIRASETMEQLVITDSLVDGGGDGGIAVAGLAGDNHGPLVKLERSTLFGTTGVKELFASETIFAGHVDVARCQTGCLRFCYVRPPDDPGKMPDTPRRYRCQPCLEIAVQKEKLEQEGITPDLIQLRREISSWLAPGFVSMRYGHPAYGQLSLGSPLQIRTGAEVGSEMGIFCNLKQPQREANLRGALEEYLRSGLEAGILYAPDKNIDVINPGGSQ